MLIPQRFEANNPVSRLPRPFPRHRPRSDVTTRSCSRSGGAEAEQDGSVLASGELRGKGEEGGGGGRGWRRGGWLEILGRTRHSLQVQGGGSRRRRSLPRAPRFDSVLCWDFFFPPGGTSLCQAPDGTLLSISEPRYGAPTNRLVKNRTPPPLPLDYRAHTRHVIAVCWR